MSDDSPKKTGTQRGRPSRDWEAMYALWRTTGAHKLAWLETQGINARSGRAYMATKDWEKRLAAEGDVAARLVEETGATTPETAASAVVTEIRKHRSKRKKAVDPEVVVDEPPGRAPVRPTTEATPAESAPAAWQIISQWRRKQAMDDWRSADVMRSHIRTVLREALKTVPSPEGPKYVTTLKPHEIRQLTQALTDLQRVQRLALGMSTDNVGIDAPVVPGSNVEKPVGPDEEPIPVFEVHMSTRGRFLRPRPARTG